MTLVYACIAPHGAEVIPQLAKGRDRARFRKTTNGMRSLAKRVKSYRPDTIVVASPHNLRLVRKIAVVEAENSSGRLSTSPGNSVTLTAKCDVRFARALLNHATQKGLPVAGANYGTSEGPASDMPMDWGTFVPLWFFLREKSPRSKVVIVTPSRDIPLEQNVKFGAVIAELAEKHRGKRIVFVASADQAHAHSKSGPYGYNKAAREYDLKIVGAIKANALGSILGLNPRLVDQAKPDSLWQMAILAGILRRVSMQAKLVSYDVPTYYGMVCAGFERVRNSS